MAVIKTIAFDYGGVISVSQRIEKRGEIAALIGLSTEELSARYSLTRGEYDRGVLSGADYWRGFNNNLSDREIESLISLDAESWMNINTTTTGLFRKLSEKFILAILSNMTYDAMPYLLESDWIRFFTHKLFSCELKDIKPNRSIYQTLARETGSAPEEIIFIDDSIENITAAGEFGIHGIHFVSGINLEAEIEKILSLQDLKN